MSILVRHLNTLLDFVKTHSSQIPLHIPSWDNYKKGLGLKLFKWGTVSLSVLQAYLWASGATGTAVDCTDAALKKKKKGFRLQQ